MSGNPPPHVGDEVEYAPGKRAILSDIERSAYRLRRPGGSATWTVPSTTALTVVRTLAQRRAAGDVS